MNEYELTAWRALKRWQIQMEKRPSTFGKFTKGAQTRINNLIPSKVHKVVTTSVKRMIQAAIIGSQITASVSPIKDLGLQAREKLVEEKLTFYQKTAAIEGAGTGSAGLLLGLADFPLLLGIKIKFLFDVASIYGFDTLDLGERLFILHVFQLAFSSDTGRGQVYKKLVNWDKTLEQFPSEVGLDSLDWRLLQQEYRDYIDLAKLLQLVPGIGAAVGAFVNYRLLDKLGETAVNCYRLRILT